MARIILVAKVIFFALVFATVMTAIMDIGSGDFNTEGSLFV
jgi:hypothetical protein